FVQDEVVMLSGMDQHRARQARLGGEGAQDGRHLHVVRPGPDHANDRTVVASEISHSQRPGGSAVRSAAESVFTLASCCNSDSVACSVCSRCVMRPSRPASTLPLTIWRASPACSALNSGRSLLNSPMCGT